MRRERSIVWVLCLSGHSSGKLLKKITEISRTGFLCYSEDLRQKEAVMIAISLALAGVGVFGAHVWDLYQNMRPAMVRVSSRRSSTRIKSDGCEL